MDSFGIREFSQHTSQIVNELTRTGEPVVITHSGRPVALVSPINTDELEDFVLANAPQFVQSYVAADRELKQRKTSSIEELRKNLSDK